MFESVEKGETYGVFEDPKILIRSIALSKGKLLKRRKEIHKSLVIAALDQYDLSSIFTVEQLSQDIITIAKCKMSSDEIISILDFLMEEDIIQHIEGLEYKLKTKVSVPGFEILSQPVWAELQEILVKKSSYDPHIHKNARVAFDSILMKILTRYAISKPLNNEIDFIPIEDIRTVIKYEVSKVTFPDNFPKKYIEILLDYFCSNEKELLKCIYNCYSWFIDLNLLSEERTSIPEEIDFSNEIKFLLLDTNFIVTLLCNTDAKHPLSSALTNFCNKVKIPLYYCQTTKEEIWRLINYSKFEMKLSENQRSNIPSQFLNDYRKLNLYRSVHWSDYFVYLNDWETILKSNFGITPLPEVFESHVDAQDMEYVKATLPMLYDVKIKEMARRDVDFEIRRRTDITYIHDARCVGIIGYVRKNPNGSSIKYLGPWFLSYDNLLADLNWHYFRKNDEFGYVVQPRILLNYLMVYSKLDFKDEDYDTIAIALLHYTVRDSSLIISFDEYVRELAVKIGTTEDNSDILKEILKKSPFLEELENALKQGSITSADSSAIKILTHPSLEKIIHDIEEVKQSKEKQGQRIQELLEVVKRQQSEIIKERTEREAWERIATQRIQIFNFVNVHFDVQNQFYALIGKLAEQGAFNCDEIPKPPTTLNNQTIKEYIENLKLIINTTDLIKDGILLLPLITEILTKIPL